MVRNWLQQMQTNKYKQLLSLGGEKAVLTLADGRNIILDNAPQRKFSSTGSAQVVKLADGRIAYNVKGLSDKHIMWNTMSTPAGGQYQITLPDATKVWLNAASSSYISCGICVGKPEGENHR